MAKPTTKSSETLPAPPPRGKPGKSLGEKLAARCAGLRRTTKAILDTVQRRGGEHPGALALLKALREVHEVADEAWGHADQLAQAKFEPKRQRQQRESLAAGKQVWLRKSVWVRKYAPLYKPEELDGLEVVAISGKLVRAKTDSGLIVTEPQGAFTTEAVAYEQAQQQ